jgi:hypothetical protein
MNGSSAIIIDRGGENDPNSIRLGTRRTKHIKNEMRAEWPPNQLREDLNRCLTSFPCLQPRSVSARYNCVGMVFATRRTWIDTEFVSQLLTDDEYRLLADKSQGQVGDIAVYKSTGGDICHVGIIIKRDVDFASGAVKFLILSKWACWAEFIHKPDEVFPSYGTLQEIWTDRRNP